MKVKEYSAKSIITKSKLPDVDYAINQYIGCSFGCVYCYASFMGRLVHEPRDNWGEYVYVKKNCVDIFKKEINRFIKNNNYPSILFSSVTDPYSHFERKYRFTRSMLQILADIKYQGKISILTKSNTVVEDLDIITALPNIEVGMTITTNDDFISKKMERRAPSTSLRLKALEKLHDANVVTYAFLGPILPHLYLELETIEKLLLSIKNLVQYIFIEHINLRLDIKNKIISTFGSSVVKNFYSNYNTKQKKEFNRAIMNLVTKHNLKLKFGQIIEHGG